MSFNPIDNLSTGHGKRGPGRPPGYTVAKMQAIRVAKAQTKLVQEKIAEFGIEAVGAAREALETDAPERTVSEAKEAALKLINRMLWTREKKAERDGVNEYDEARVLKLLAGLNAALPKQAETPIKATSDMTEEELRKAAGR
jgi:hypothetical protein